MVRSYRSVEALLCHRSSASPVVCLRPHLIRARASAMVGAFPGDVLYAVKCNDAPEVLRALWDGGVRQFDTASLAEIRAVRTALPGAACHFMHPVKSAEAIDEAYRRHGVRRFVLDHMDELQKILAVTGMAQDLELIVRLAVPGEGAMLSLTGKFGVPVEDAVDLLRAARRHARSTGLTFHVGSQCVDVRAFTHAIRLVGEVVRRAGAVDHLDVGGGFPARYAGDEPEFAAFVAVIEDTLLEQGLDGTALQCEPGRMLVADGASVLTRIELRRGQALYLNDGVYGNLAELKWVGPRFPLRLLRDGAEVEAPEAGFDLFGPTCDSIDSMPGPHRVAGSAMAGDWIEVGMMGAYSTALSTRFNGFASDAMVVVEDAGWYLGERRSELAAPSRAAA